MKHSFHSITYSRAIQRAKSIKTTHERKTNYLFLIPLYDLLYGRNTWSRKVTALKVFENKKLFAKTNCVKTVSTKSYHTSLGRNVFIQNTKINKKYKLLYILCYNIIHIEKKNKIICNDFFLIWNHCKLLFFSIHTVTFFFNM